MKQTLTNNHISIKTRKRAVKTYIWSVHGSETWVLKTEDKNRLDVREMKS